MSNTPPVVGGFCFYETLGASFGQTPQDGAAGARTRWQLKFDCISKRICQDSPGVPCRLWRGLLKGS